MTRDEVAGLLIARVLTREGGVADVGDGKGITRWGQTPGWLDQFGLPTPTTKAEAEANYRTWLVRTGLMGLCDHADSLADATIDYAIHSGHRVAIRSLQSALGVAMDGIYGPETQAAVDVCERRWMAQRILGQRVRLLGRLITDLPARSKWAAGWLNRLGDQIETLA